MVKVFYYFFIARKLNIFAEENISEPHKRIEPIKRKQKKSERFPQMVFAANMRLLVSDNKWHILFAYADRQIYFRFYNSQNKRR